MVRPAVLHELVPQFLNHPVEHRKRPANRAKGRISRSASPTQISVRPSIASTINAAMRPYWFPFFPLRSLRAGGDQEEIFMFPESSLPSRKDSLLGRTPIRNVPNGGAFGTSSPFHSAAENSSCSPPAISRRLDRGKTVTQN